MKIIAKIAVAVVVNALALVVAAYFVMGFNLEVDLRSLFLLAAVLTALNFFLKPILKLILGPIIVITLGLGLILVNAVILYILDMLSNNLNIDGVGALLYSSIIIGLVNFVFHLATKQ